MTSTHAVRKKWKEVYIQYVMLRKQRSLQSEVAKTSVLKGPKRLNVLLLGLDRSGKSTFLYRILLNRMIVSIPTVGANRETVSLPLHSRGGVILERQMKVTDVGGIAPMRLLWGEYLRDASKYDVLAFMVDASDTERLAQATAEFSRCMQMVSTSSSLSSSSGSSSSSSSSSSLTSPSSSSAAVASASFSLTKPVIVLACKFDIHRALSAYQLCKKMRLADLLSGGVPKKERRPQSGGNNNLWCCQSISNVTGHGIVEAIEWMMWATTVPQTTDSECWYCRGQEVEESSLKRCGKCNHMHCPACVQVEKDHVLCKTCFYCRNC